MRTSFFIAALCASGVLGAAIYGTVTSMASESHNAHSGHGQMTERNISQMPKEGGQSAFAAIAEIIAMLEADPSTDWSQVNIDALRAHLVDMDKLTTEARVTQSYDGTNITFTITGIQTAIDAASRMVPAHAAELSKSDQWTIETSALGSAVQMIVTPTPQMPIEKIEALGFFGIMATGSHHQPHHFGMANGTMVH